jgi:hypothetical protein
MGDNPLQLQALKRYLVDEHTISFKPKTKTKYSDYENYSGLP